MAATVSTYLNFKDSTKDAVDFYHSAFGGELRRSSFAEYQVNEDPAGHALSISGDDERELCEYRDALAASGVEVRRLRHSGATASGCAGTASE